MYIKLMQNYKTFNANHIVRCGRLEGKKLIDKGIAERVDRIFCVEDLYIAQLVGVKKSFCGNIEVGVDMGLKVFTRYSESFLDLSDKRVYTHALTKNHFYPTDHEDKLLHTKPGAMVVRAESVRTFSEFFMDDLALNNLTVYDYISDKDIKRAEIYLNSMTKKKETDKSK